MARQAASAFAGLWVNRKKFEPAVVTTPFMSMLSLIARRRRLSPVSAGNCLMKARSPGRCLVNNGTAEQPLSALKTKIATEIARISADLKIAARKNPLNDLDILRIKKMLRLRRLQENRAG